MRHTVALLPDVTSAQRIEPMSILQHTGIACVSACMMPFPENADEHQVGYHTDAVLSLDG